MCATAVFRLKPHGRINLGLLGDSGQWESTMWLNIGRWKQSNESEAARVFEKMKLMLMVTFKDPHFCVFWSFERVPNVHEFLPYDVL